MKWVFWFLFGFYALLSCVRKPKPEDSKPQPSYTGLYVLNEGQWTLSNASLDVWSSAGTYYEDVYRAVNGHPLGDVANHWLREADTLWIVLNASRLLRRIRLPSLREEYTLAFPASASPREFLRISSSKAYVNSLTDGTVYRLDPTVGRLTPPHIPIENFAESMLLWEGKVWITCGNYAYPARNDKLACIDPISDTVQFYLTLPRENPGPLVALPNGEILVGCRGNYADLKGMLVHVDPRTGSLTRAVDLLTSVYRLQRYGEEIYMLTDSGVSRYDWRRGEVDYAFFSRGRLGVPPHELIYGFHYDSLTGTWLIANAKAGGVRGELLVLQQGEEKRVFRAGVFPSRILRYP
ncbi:MAG: hypothetical protein N2170_07805 [Bacteroidia bacterium]|nr:hypothetical protein [Bacteroidia bacterium]